MYFSDSIDFTPGMFLSFHEYETSKFDALHGIFDM